MMIVIVIIIIRGLFSLDNLHCVFLCHYQFSSFSYYSKDQQISIVKSFFQSLKRNKNNV